MFPDIPLTDDAEEMELRAIKAEYVKWSKRRPRIEFKKREREEKLRALWKRWGEVRGRYRVRVDVE